MVFKTNRGHIPAKGAMDRSTAFIFAGIRLPPTYGCMKSTLQVAFLSQTFTLVQARHDGEPITRTVVRRTTLRSGQDACVQRDYCSFASALSNADALRS
jgi:hypothetical protein